MKRACALLFALVALFAPLRALAQGFDDDPGIFPGGQAPPPPPPPGGPPGQQGPETHAAADDEAGSRLPTQAPQLPSDPNAIPKELEGVLHSDFDPEFEHGRERDTTRSFYGPYYSEESGDYAFKTIFPLWIERTQGEDRASLFGLSYYNRRSPRFDADVLFPLFWNLREDDTHTTVVGPVMHRESPAGHDNWLAPLYFEGTGAGGKSYLHIPPLLTFHTRDLRGGFSMAGPLFCKWKSGPSCDARTADEIAMGVAPFYFYGRDDRSEYEIIPPLLRYYSYEDRGEEELDIWGPVWLERSREGGVTNVLPLFWHNWKANEANTTLLPFFHYGYEGNASTLATPLFVSHTDEDGANTFATYLYARHRGRTELDMVTPLFWRYADPDIGLERYLLLPFFYKNSSPRSDDLAILPFYAHFQRYGLSNEHWVTPLFRHQTSVTGWETDVFPFFYLGRENYSTHFVLAPIVWDFNSPNERATVVFPAYWRFRDEDSLVQVAGNTIYIENKVPGGTDWQFHFFPAFSYGESPNGHWWNVLYGLAGYTQEGTRAKMRIAYIPITLSE